VEDEEKEDEEDEDEELTPSERQKRALAQMALHKDVLSLLVDPVFRSSVQAALLIIQPLRSASVQLQADTVTCSVITALSGAYAIVAAQGARCR
jgi:hypothetical protein